MSGGRVKMTSEAHTFSSAVLNMMVDASVRRADEDVKFICNQGKTTLHVNMQLAKAASPFLSAMFENTMKEAGKKRVNAIINASMQTYLLPFGTALVRFPHSGISRS